MKKTSTKFHFEKDLNRFLRSLMSKEEEKGFLDFLKANPQYANRAYLSTLIIHEIRMNAADDDKKIIAEVKEDVYSPLKTGI